jgi:GTP-binding protein Era
MSTGFRSGFASIVGVPNAGKSSLLNALLKESVSIVTKKPQTTRKRTLGVLTEDDKYQVVFVDTPGVVEADTDLNSFLKEELQKSFDDVDLVVCAMAPWELKAPDTIPWCLSLSSNLKKKKFVYIVTHADRLTDEKRAEISSKLGSVGLGDEFIFTSVVTGEGLGTLKERIVAELEEGPAFYDSEIYTTQTMRELVAETVRKHCFELLHQEVPYGLGVVVRSFKEGKVTEIEADVVLSRESHKPMVIGKGGAMLKAIGTASREEIEQRFGFKVYLKLFVQVRQNWQSRKDWMSEMGYGAN